MGRSVLLKTYTFRNGALSIRPNQLLYRTADVTVTDGARNATRQMVNPDSPKKTIREILMGPAREMATVEGVVVKVCIIL